MEAWNLLTKPFKAKPPKQVCMPRGCLECRDTGYLGRVGLYEILPLTEAIKSIVTAETDIDSLRRAGMKEGMHTLRLSGAQKVGAGLTTMAEVLRVSPASQSL